MSIPFPSGCRYERQGFCLRAELLNPGLEAALRCVRLTELMRDWDGFLDRAERFGLPEEEAARIWNARHHNALKSRELCPHSRPAPVQAWGGEAEFDCAYLFRSACLLAMPRCEGRCEYFAGALSRRG